MFNRMLELVAKVALGKKLLALVNAGNQALVGKRTEILAGITAVIAVLEHTGHLDKATAHLIEAALIGAMPITAGDKLKRVLAQADRVLPPPPAAPQDPPGAAPQG